MRWGVGAGVRRVGQLNLCVETIHYFEGINVTILKRMHQFIMNNPNIISHHVIQHS